VQPSYLVSAADGRQSTGLVSGDQRSVEGLKLISYLLNGTLNLIGVAIVGAIEGREASSVAVDGARQDVRGSTACDEDLII
jgi:hypothetical protein